VVTPCKIQLFHIPNWFTLTKIIKAETSFNFIIKRTKGTLRGKGRKDRKKDGESVGGKLDWRVKWRMISFIEKEYSFLVY
jgi:hypothetical protein